MWKRYRRIVSWVEALVILGLPFLHINGQSVLRFDIPTLSLYFFGHVIRLSEFYFILFGVLFFFVLVIWITAIFGRVWCGWLCPQTVLLDLADDASRIFFKNRSLGPKLILVPLTAIVSASLIWYFVPPEEFFQKVFHSRVITGFFLVQWVVIYLELAFAGRKFCKYVCPYSMLQTALFDKDTLVVAFKGRPEEFEGKRSCLMCRQCERVCPVEIDIKKGLQRQCIGCAECIDACRDITSKQGIREFISYKGRILRPRFFALGGVTMVFGLIMVLSVVMSPPITVVIKRDPHQGSRLVNSYSYVVTNNLSRQIEVDLSVEGPYTFIGQSSINIRPFEVFTGHFFLRQDSQTTQSPVVIIKTNGYEIKQRVGYL